jgi:hypothetical protein
VMHQWRMRSKRDDDEAAEKEDRKQAFGKRCIWSQIL